jgi:hypothetical protein
MPDSMQYGYFQVYTLSFKVDYKSFFCILCAQNIINLI